MESQTFLEKMVNLKKFIEVEFKKQPCNILLNFHDRKDLKEYEAFLELTGLLNFRHKLFTETLKSHETREFLQRKRFIYIEYFGNSLIYELSFENNKS